MSRRQALFFLRPESFEDIYGAEERTALASRVHIVDPLVTEESYRGFARTWPGIEMIFSGWGMATCDQQFLDRFPDLKIIFYGGGSIRHFITDSFWEKGMRITSGAAANAIPVSEYALSQILFGLKQGWQTARFLRQHRRYPSNFRPAGAYQSAVGLISLGLIGRRVAKRLRSFDLRVLAYDPFVTEAEARELGVELVSLDELFRRSDVVSCHAPDLEETRKMIGTAHFAGMKEGATFINTARGRVVDESGMTEVLKKRPDLTAVLDVTHPEPPLDDSPLFGLENVILTPHIAGSIGAECRRMGQLMVEELDRYLAGEPLRHEIHREQSLLLA
jgi:phosphoglycerate dehydrogenase-like enzyme